ncbi:16627_t:CDS:1, partial [Cetraspora pellucida]
MRAFINQKKQHLDNKQNKITNNECDKGDKNYNLVISNLSITKCKGRPETKRYKSSIKKACHQPYACHTCDQICYNSAR